MFSAVAVFGVIAATGTIAFPLRAILMKPTNVRRELSVLRQLQVLLAMVVSVHASASLFRHLYSHHALTRTRHGVGTGRRHLCTLRVRRCSNGREVLGRASRRLGAHAVATRRHVSACGGLRILSRDKSLVDHSLYHTLCLGCAHNCAHTALAITHLEPSRDRAKSRGDVEAKRVRSW
jgi:hypothetical protein